MKIETSITGLLLGKIGFLLSISHVSMESKYSNKATVLYSEYRFLLVELTISRRIFTANSHYLEDCI